MNNIVVIARAIGAVAVRPGLWPTALRVARRTAPRRWWRRAPFLPLPTRDYIEFRLTTQYGATTPDDLGADIVSYLGWCRSLERAG